MNYLENDGKENMPKKVNIFNVIRDKFKRNKHQIPIKNRISSIHPIIKLILWIPLSIGIIKIAQVLYYGFYFLFGNGDASEFFSIVMSFFSVIIIIAVLLYLMYEGVREEIFGD